MLNGMYVATGGLLMQERRVDYIANNIANANTAGYHKDRPVFTLYRPNDDRYPQNIIRESEYNKTINSTVRIDEVYTNHEPGVVKQTGNTMDFSLANPKAFFVVDTPYGIRYTRAGQFTMNDNGELVTRDGYPVLSRAQDQTAGIQIPNGQTGQVQVDENGNIFFGGAQINQFETVTFEDVDKLQKIGNSLYQAVDTLPVEAENPGIQQGYLELSNVEPVSEMVRMIDAMRGFEMYQKVIHTYDELNEQAATRIAATA